MKFIDSKVPVKHQQTVKEREDNGAKMSDEKEINDQMSAEYSGEDQVKKAEKLNEKERNRTEGSKLNDEEV